MKPGAKHLVAVTAAAAAALITVAGLAWYYYTHDPSEGAGAKCTFKLLTGYDCPGCGSQRALHAMLHGDIAQEAGRRHWPRLHAASVKPVIIIAIFIAIVAYWIGRNL